MCSLCNTSPCRTDCPMSEEAIPVLRCLKCGDPIFDSEEYYDIDGEPWCESCIKSSRKTVEREETWE